MTKTERAAESSRCRLAALGIVGALAALALLLRVDLPPYDDAFFFLRFARNLVDHGVYAWNIADGPVYGLTSQLFGLLTVLVHAVAPSSTILATRLLLAACLPLATWLLLRAGGRPVPVVLALCSPIALATISSGLETAVALLFGGAWLAAVRSDEEEIGATLAAGLVLVGYLVRPDSLLLTLPTLLLQRRFGALAMAGGGLALLLLGFHALYGAALPLSFTVKSGLADLTGPDFLARCRDAKLRHALYFALVAWPLLVGALLAPRRGWDGRRLRRLGLLLPAGLFIAYHLLLTVDIMGLHARFFVPALPWLALAATDRRTRRTLLLTALGIAALLVLGARLDLLPRDHGWSIGRVHPASTLAWCAAAVLAALPRPAGSGPRLVAVGILAALGVGVADRRLPDRLPDDAASADALSAEVTSWRGAERLRRCLGGDLDLFHSEIGVLGVMFPDAGITDLGGLMTPGDQLADLGALCSRRRPDAIFQPHRNYARLNRRLLESGCLTGYTRVTEGGSSPLWLRDDHLAAWDCDR